MDLNEIKKKLGLYIDAYEQLLNEKTKLEEEIERLQEENFHMVEKLQATIVLIDEANKSMAKSVETMKVMEEDMRIYDERVNFILGNLYEKFENIMKNKNDKENEIDLLKREIENTKDSIRELKRNM